MPGPLATTALVQGGSAIGKYLFGRFGRKRTAFKDTDYGRLLAQRAKTGIFTPGMRRKIIGNVGREAGNIAANVAAASRGRLISKGAEGSIAGARGLAEIQSKPVGAVSQARTEIDIRNDLSRIEAAEKLAAGQTDYKMALQERENRLKSELVGGLLGAGGNYLAGKASQKSFENIDFGDDASIQKWIAEQPDQAAAVNLLRNLASANQYSQGRGVDKWTKAKRAIADYQSNPDPDPRQFLLDLKTLGLSEKDIDMIVKMLEN
jgi:hypothetical protein